jgi:hypothetical protein
MACMPSPTQQFAKKKKPKRKRAGPRAKTKKKIRKKIEPTAALARDSLWSYLHIPGANERTTKIKTKNEIKYLDPHLEADQPPVFVKLAVEIMAAVLALDIEAALVALDNLNVAGRHASETTVGDQPVPDLHVVRGSLHAMEFHLAGK